MSTPSRELHVPPRITFSNRQRGVKVDTGWFRRFSKIALARCLAHPPRKASVLAGLETVDVIIVSNKVIAEIHRRFMDVEGPTDVITFDHGEIVISAQMAQTQAKKYRKPIDREIGLYIVHGLLHLNGYGDKSSRDFEVMRKTQSRILADCLSSPDWRL